MYSIQKMVKFKVLNNIIVLFVFWDILETFFLIQITIYLLPIFKQHKILSFLSTLVYKLYLNMLFGLSGQLQIFNLTELYLEKVKTQFISLYRALFLILLVESNHCQQLIL
jgi:hypothetical protein